MWDINRIIPPIRTIEYDAYGRIRMVIGDKVRALRDNAEKEDNQRKRKRKTLLSEKKEVCSKNV